MSVKVKIIAVLVFILTNMAYMLLSSHLGYQIFRGCYHIGIYGIITVFLIQEYKRAQSVDEIVIFSGATLFSVFKLLYSVMAVIKDERELETIYNSSIFSVVYSALAWIIILIWFIVLVYEFWWKRYRNKGDGLA